MAKPSSSTEGFFQDLPTLLPQVTLQEHPSASNKPGTTNFKNTSDDVALARTLALHLPSSETKPIRTIHQLSRRALDPEVLAHATDAEINHPVLRSHTTFGQENRVDPLWTASGWKVLKLIGQQEGIITTAYDTNITTWNRRIQSFAMNFVWSSTGTMTGCPMAMTDGAAKLLLSHRDDEDEGQVGRARVLKESYARLISSDASKVWTSGQWMTERAGGSDVSGTETVARHLTDEELATAASQGRDLDAHGLPLGPWTIDGFKWFSSATDSEMSMLLAQSPKGLSLFYAPMRRKLVQADTNASELNGIRIQRLKNKVGTKALPTAELELKGMRAWLVGQEGKGVKKISTILNLTRLYTASGAVAGWSRGMQVCRAYSKVRKVRGGLLQDNKLHLRWMAAETVKYHAAVHFSFFGVALLGVSEQGWEDVVKNTNASNLIPKDPTQSANLARLLTPVIKSQTSLASVLGVRECMESLGGVGYCENNEDGGLLNLGKVFRDILVSPIWEGTISVMAEDVVRVISDKRVAGGDILEFVFATWVHGILDLCKSQFSAESGLVRKRLEVLISLTRGCGKEELLFRGRDILGHLEAIACACILMFDACTDGDEVAVEITRRWIRSKALVESEQQIQWNWEEEAAMDKKIFLAQHDSGVNRAAAKL